MKSCEIARLLLRAGLRPTSKRVAIASLLFSGQDKHVAVEDVVAMVEESGVKVSLATIYNTLNQFSAAGLLRRINLDGERTFYDTNTCDHHHIYHEDDGRLIDVPGEMIRVMGLPDLGKDETINSVEVFVRVGRRSAS